MNKILHIPKKNISNYLTEQLNDSMEPSPSWESKSPLTGQELHRILWNPMVHYRIHKRPSLSWARSIQSVPPHRVCWRSILILSSHKCLGLPSVSFLSGSSNQNPICTSFLPRTCHMPRPYHSSWLDHPKIFWVLHSIQLLVK